jgi:hypothetical protein
MVAYNMKFLQFCFQSKAHPYQHKWDVLDESFPNKNVFEVQLIDLQSLVKGSLWHLLCLVICMIERLNGENKSLKTILQQWKHKHWQPIEKFMKHEWHINCVHCMYISL